MSPNTMTKMHRDQKISMSVLLKIGDYLDCGISEIMEFVKDKYWRGTIRGAYRFEVFYKKEFVG
nr:helix-turn-helix transcriptional regulator [uncultured Roseburia sp.]